MSVVTAEKSLIELIRNAFSTGKPIFSVEFLPGTTPQLHRNLQESIRALAIHPPLFATVTWHNSHKITSESEIHHPALELADELQNKHKIITCLHLAAGDLKRNHIESILDRAWRMGVRSILALRGDQEPLPGNDFHTGADVVRFVRDRYGQKFTIAVAGYPSTGHSEARYQQGLLQLKKKVEAGADFVITQVILRAKDFLSFYEDCRNLGINVPIIPGLLATKVQSCVKSLERMAILTKSCIPLDITEKVCSMQNDSKAQRDFVQNLTLTTAKELVDYKKFPVIHFFTMNRGLETIQIWNQINSDPALRF